MIFFDDNEGQPWTTKNKKVVSVVNVVVFFQTTTMDNLGQQ